MQGSTRKGTTVRLSAAQRGILEQALRANWFNVSAVRDEVACLEMWRTGLLRMNGEPSYQITLMGVEALRSGA